VLFSRYLSGTLNHVFFVLIFALIPLAVFAEEAIPPAGESACDPRLRITADFAPPPSPLTEEEMGELLLRSKDNFDSITPEQYRQMRESASNATNRSLDFLLSDEAKRMMVDPSVKEYAQKLLADHFKATHGKMTLKGNPVMFMFISSSVPMSTLQSYADAMNRIPYSVVFVLRGFVGDMKDFLPTMEFIKTFTKWKENEHAMFGVIIDPILFGKYKIQHVPTLVFDPAAVMQDYSLLVSKDDASLENKQELRNILHDPVPEDSFFAISGDVSLDYLVDILHRETKSEYLSFLVDRLRRNTFYDGS